MNEEDNKLLEDMRNEVKAIRIILSVQLAVFLVLFFILVSSLRW